MSDQDLITLSGVPGSPYTRKMLAVLRYRRLPYRLLLHSHNPPGYPAPKVPLLPTFYYPDDNGELQPVTDSTPILRRLEQEHQGRSARPSNPALALIDSLIEDYGDEWLTKAMFHFRWHFPEDIAKASAILPAFVRGRVPDDQFKTLGKEIADRQMPRLRYVGSNEHTWAFIEDSYRRFVDLMEEHLKTRRFWLGDRPGAGDFGVYGQLTQLAMFDPTSMAITLEKGPRVFGWTAAVDDLSGLEPTEDDWFHAAALPDTAKALLSEIGRVYAPLLIANAKAAQAGEAQVKTTIDGKPWVQNTFPYQAKCLMWLRQEYAALAGDDRKVADAALAGTGCEILFAGA